MDVVAMVIMIAVLAILAYGGLFLIGKGLVKKKLKLVLLGLSSLLIGSIVLTIGSYIDSRFNEVTIALFSTALLMFTLAVFVLGRMSSERKQA